MSVKATDEQVAFPSSSPITIIPSAPSPAIPWPPPPDQPSPEPLSARSIQAQQEADPAIAQVVKTTLGVNLGNNTTIPIPLRPEQQTRFQALLDTAAEQVKNALTHYLVTTDRHQAKWEQDEEHVTWFRYNANSRSIEYQIHNEAKLYYISLKDIKTSSDFDPTQLIEASSQLEKALSEITGIPIKHITYQDGSITLFTGPQPFDKSISPALKSLADKSFEQALDVVKQQLTRKDAAEAAQKNFKALKEALESEKTDAVKTGQGPTVQILDGLIQELDAMDGFAVGIAASSQLEPKDYTSALQLYNEIYQSVCDQMEAIEEHDEPSFGENISRAWQGWRDPAAKAAREQGRRAAAKQYAADVVGLCLDHEMTPETSAELQAASHEIHLRTRTVESGHSLEHRLYTYLTTGATGQLKVFLAERFADPADPNDQAGALLAEKICDKLAPPSLQDDEELEDDVESDEEVDLP